MRCHAKLLERAAITLVGFSVLLAAPVGSARENDSATPAPPRPAVTAPLASTSAVSLTLALGAETYSGRSPAPIVARMEYLARAEPANVARPPLNLAIVLDRSGSMADAGKMKFALDAARVVVENLSERDYVSIVAYGEHAVVLSPSGRAVNKTYLLHRLDEVVPEGWTDMSAGVLAGMAQIASTAAPEQSRHLLVLTDGQANRGVVDLPGLRRLAEQASAQGIVLSTFGCGADVDPKALQGMASAGRGRYTFIRNAEQIPGAFMDEMHGALQVVAQNVGIEFDAGSSRIGHVYGGGERAAASTLREDIGDLRAGEAGSILLRIDAAKEIASSGEVVARITWDDPATGKRQTTESLLALSAAATGDNDIGVSAAILEGIEKATQALEGLDRENARTARTIYSEMYDLGRRRATETHDQNLLNETFLLKHLMEELSTMEAAGWTHDHGNAKSTLNEADFQRYLLRHHSNSSP